MPFFLPHQQSFPLPPPPERYRLHLTLLIGTLTLGTALRLYHLGHWALWYDEAAAIYLTRFVDFKGSLFVDTNTTEAPMLAVLVYFWKGLIDLLVDWPATVPRYDFALRLLPCAFSIATMPLLYRVGLRVLQDPWAALVAVFLFAISPFFVHYAQELRIYAFYTFCALAATYFLLRALDEDQRRHWAGMIFFLALIMYSHFIAMWTIFAFGVFYLCCIRQYGRYFWKWTAWFALLMLVITPSLMLAFKMNAHVLELRYPWFESPDLKTALITFKNFYAGFGPTTWAYWPLFIAALSLFALGLFALRRRYPAMMLIGVFVIVPIGGNVILWASRDFSFYEHRLFIFSGLISILGVAAGLRALPWRTLQIAALAFIALTTSPLLLDYYHEQIHPIPLHRYGINSKVDYRAAAAYIDAHAEPGDIVIYTSHFHVYSLHHYLKTPHYNVGGYPEARRDLIWTLGNAPLLRAHRLLPEMIDEVLQGKRRIWFLRTSGITFEWQPTVDMILDKLRMEWSLAETQEYHGLTVYLLQR